MTNNLIKIREEKLEKIRLEGDAYPNDFKPSIRSSDVINLYESKTREELDSLSFNLSVCGRIITQRIMGGVIFITIRDNGTLMQIYLNKKEVGEDLFNIVKHWDIGDIIGVSGTLFRTKTNEITVRSKNLRLLTKSLLPPAEKFHGITDIDEKYRRRYASLISNPDDRKIFETRNKAIRYLRDFFHNRDYFEFETPILQSIPGGAAARPFVTECNSLNCDFYLRIAQELYIKRLLVGGFDNVFEINKNFRNEGVSPRHNPEFTMLEFNSAYKNYHDFMNLTEELLTGIVFDLTGGYVLNYQGNDISFERPFERLSPKDAILKYCPSYTNENLCDKSFMVNELKKILMSKENLPYGDSSNVELKINNMSIHELQFSLFEETTEHLLIQPTFIIDYPASLSPLSKVNPNDSNLAERFEMFVAGMELVNGFSELNDPQLQSDIFKQQAANKNAGDQEAMYYDEDYINALMLGLPPNAGGGVGVDRLIMLLTDSASIRDVILFPQLKQGNSENA